MCVIKGGNERLELILKEGLPHQQKAIDLVCNVFNGVQIDKPVFYYTNPTIDIHNPKLLENIRNIQEDIHPTLRGSNEINEYLNLDIKMETGTGKTYVYTSTIFELQKRYGINKFIIAVPSLPIKAGTGQFISDEYVKRHFRDVCKYGTEIDLQILESLKVKKGKRFFPSVVTEFVKGSNQNKNKIFVLLVNMHLLTDKKNTMLVRDDYDYGVEGFYCPVDAIKTTKPVV
jgi:type III restriction enzyme